MTESTVLYLVRHGQTQWNKEHRLQGHKNSPLTNEGKQQALSAKNILNEIDINCAYVSPLKRAQQTCGIILEPSDIMVKVFDNLKEINLGPWEGKTKEETRQSHPKEFWQFWHDQDEFFLQGAETYEQLQTRIVKGLKDIIINEKNKNVLIVSHWIAIKVAVAYFTKTPLKNLSNIENIENGGIITLIIKNGKIELVSMH